MEAADALFWLCASLNLGVAGSLTVYLRGRVKAQRFTEEQAKRVYSWLCLGSSMLSGVVAFFGIVALFHIPIGHGEILVAAPLFNLLLGGVLIIAGRTGIGWVPMRW